MKSFFNRLAQRPALTCLSFILIALGLVLMIMPPRARAQAGSFQPAMPNAYYSDTNAFPVTLLSNPTAGTVANFETNAGLILLTTNNLVSTIAANATNTSLIKYLNGSRGLSITAWVQGTNWTISPVETLYFWGTVDGTISNAFLIPQLTMTVTGVTNQRTAISSNFDITHMPFVRAIFCGAVSNALSTTSNSITIGPLFYSQPSIY